MCSRLRLLALRASPNPFRKQQKVVGAQICRAQRDSSTCPTGGMGPRIGTRERHRPPLSRSQRPLGRQMCHVAPAEEASCGSSWSHEGPEGPPCNPAVADQESSDRKHRLLSPPSHRERELSLLQRAHLPSPPKTAPKEGGKN